MNKNASRKNCVHCNTVVNWLRKISKFDATISAPDPAGGPIYCTPPDPLAVFMGPASNWRDGGRGRAAHLVQCIGQLSLASPGVAKSSISFGWNKGRNITSAGWQVTLCDPIWHVSSRRGEAVVHYQLANRYTAFTFFVTWFMLLRIGLYCVSYFLGISHL